MQFLLLVLLVTICPLFLGLCALYVIEGERRKRYKSAVEFIRWLDR